LIWPSQITSGRVPRFPKRHSASCFPKLDRLWRAPLTYLTYVTSLTLILLAAPLLHAASEHTYTNIYQRTVVEFEAANFMKPAEKNAEELTFKLAPLLMQEVVSGQSHTAVGLNGLATESGVKGDQVGALVISNGTVTFDGSHPTIYSELAIVSIHGKPHIQATYLWFYSAAQSASSNSVLTSQGIRLTLDSGGKPVIWEAMADTSGARVMFVSESLEAAARAKFGPPLPDRRYAVERSVEAAPAVVVARVIDDGPIPMGPFVYLSAGTRCVSTVLCRCMPPQVKSLFSTRTYDLAPSQDAHVSLATTTNVGPAASAFADGQPRARLEDCLRLLDDF
jgi:hypothetical protein